MQIISIIMQILGGLGTFLIGMKMLSENMMRLAHGKLKTMLNKTAGNRFANVGIGAAVTVIGQSSALTTVMVVGLVNAGIMSLFQATAIIMGANIGTTLTAWVISLSGFGSFDVMVFTLCFTAVGVFMSMFSKNEKVKSAGNAVAALGLIFVGLEFVSSAMSFEPGSTEFEAVSSILSKVTNPILLLLIGIAITALIQSSMAVTAIVVTMAGVGLTIGGGGNAALFIIIGSNIGTCITALISSIGANSNAKRAAVIHFLFNVFGAVIFTILLVCWKGFAATILASVFPSNPSMQIAMFHTLFNVVCTLLFLPFISVFVWFADHLVREKPQPQEQRSALFSEIDERLLRSPSVALGYFYEETGKAFSYAMDTLGKAMEGFLHKDPSSKEQVDAMNAELAQVNRIAVSYLVKLSSASLVLSEEKTISSLHYTLNDIMRIGELADNVTKYTDHYKRDGLVFSDEFMEKIQSMYGDIVSLYELSSEAFLRKDTEKLKEVDALEERIDSERKELIAAHIERLNEGKCQPQNSNVFINLVGNLERAADHITFIAHSIDSDR